jgi:hypothetical protein
MWPAEVRDAYDAAVARWKYEDPKEIKSHLSYGSGRIVWGLDNFSDRRIHEAISDLNDGAEYAMGLGAALYSFNLLLQIPESVRSPYSSDEILGHDDEGYELTPKGPMKPQPD